MAGFPFLDLPPEIRNRIYFFTDSLIATLSDHKQSRKYEPVSEADRGNCVFREQWFCRYCPISDLWCLGGHIPFPSQPNITRVCCQIREETLPVFYGANGFIIEDWYWEAEGVQTHFPKILLGWLTSIRHHLHLMTSVAILCKTGCVQRGARDCRHGNGPRSRLQGRSIEGVFSCGMFPLACEAVNNFEQSMEWSEALSEMSDDSVTSSHPHKRNHQTLARLIE